MRLNNVIKTIQPLFATDKSQSTEVASRSYVQSTACLFFYCFHSWRMGHATKLKPLWPLAYLEDIK